MPRNYAVLALLMLLITAAARAQLASEEPPEIIKLSVAKLQADWKAAPQYSYTERDVEIKGSSQTIKTYRVLMIDGSPYNRLIAINDEPLPAEQNREEEEKLARGIEHRKTESSRQRAERIGRYLRERRQDEALLREMVTAFHFTAAGEEMVNGYKTYAFDASPRADYHPPSRETSVLTGMRGKLWIDTDTHQWVKVKAEVFRPVTFGLFIARVSPGTQFVLEQQPVANELWLPKHFRTEVSALILGIHKSSIDDETYSNYREETAGTELKRGEIPK